MKILTFFEQIANHAHHQAEIMGLIDLQPKSFQEIIKLNDSKLLREHITDSASMAHTTKVVQI